MSLTLDYFMDENLKLYQDKEHFRFNTDTKLLAKFVHLKKQERILDIGTNNACLLYTSTSPRAYRAYSFEYYT
uniref:hypothetical protein n=1 Tax=Holdemanella porci TaxID=2652276 RepID=UPI003FEFC3BF